MTIRKSCSLFKLLVWITNLHLGDETLNEAPGFEMRSKNTELDERDFRQFAIHGPSAAPDTAKVLVSRTKGGNDEPCYPACSLRSFQGVDKFLEEWR